ncbi:MAG: DUF2000 domain-containing protein [Pseudomonadota bacterium]|jgi:hypothetical protein|nr:DUF2000 domain-containing protein [Alphaproteobacteria bacterium]
MTFSNKLVAVLNKELPSGVALNALAHMTLGLGAKVGSDRLHLDIYKDRNGLEYPNISQMPFIILRGKSSEIKKLVQQMREHKVAHGAFINTMTGGTYIEQLEKTAKFTDEELVFYGCVAFGPLEELNAMTKKFSLWKD